MLTGFSQLAHITLPGVMLSSWKSMHSTKTVVLSHLKLRSYITVMVFHFIKFKVSFAIVIVIVPCGSPTRVHGTVNIFSLAPYLPKDLKILVFPSGTESFPEITSPISPETVT